MEPKFVGSDLVNPEERYAVKHTHTHGQTITSEVTLSPILHVGRLALAAVQHIDLVPAEHKNYAYTL